MKKILPILLISIFITAWGPFERWGNYGFGYSQFSNIFLGELTQLNTDPNFQMISSEDPFPASNITAADPPVLTFAGQSEIIVSSDNRDFTTWSNVNWAGYSGGTVSDGTGKLECMMDASGFSGCRLEKAYTEESTDVGAYYLVAVDLWQGTTTETDFRISLGHYNNYKTVTISGTQQSFEVVLQYPEVDDLYTYLYVYSPDGDSGSFYIDNVSIKKLHDYSTDDIITIGGADNTYGTEYFPNGDMEDTPTDDWSQFNATEAIETTEVHTGSQSLYSTATSNYGTLFRVETVDSGGIVEVVAWIKSTVGIQYSLQDNTNTVDIIRSGYTTYTDWTKIYFTADVPDDCTALKLVFTAQDNGFDLYVDDVSVTQIVPVQAVPYRITAIDSDGQCTLGDADFSDLSAAITEAYTAKTGYDYYTLGDGWIPGTTPDYTLIDDGTLTSGEVYFIQSTEVDNFYTDCGIAQFFISDGTETCDNNNTVFHIPETFAKCDGSQLTQSDLVCTDATITKNKGYRITTEVDEISSGGITPIVSTKSGVEISIAGTNTQNIKSDGTTGVSIRASTAADGVKITEWKIEKYR